MAKKRMIKSYQCIYERIYRKGIETGMRMKKANKNRRTSLERRRKCQEHAVPTEQKEMAG
jgi:hypothetical protein